MTFGLDRASDLFGFDIGTVEIDSLNDLMEFIDTNGKVIIYPAGVHDNRSDENIPTIMIYDTYVES